MLTKIAPEMGQFVLLPGVRGNRHSRGRADAARRLHDELHALLRAHCIGLSAAAIPRLEPVQSGQVPVYAVWFGNVILFSVAAWLLRKVNQH